MLPFHVPPYRKFEEISPPKLNEFVNMTDGNYTSDRFIHMEYVFLKALAFKMAAPTAHQFLHLFLSMHPVCAVTENLAMVSLTIYAHFFFHVYIHILFWFNVFYIALPLVCSRVKPAGNGSVPTVHAICGGSCSLHSGYVHCKQNSLGTFIQALLL